MSLDWILVGIAASLLALNQGIKDAPALRGRLPRLPGWVSYIPVLLFLVAVAIRFSSTPSPAAMDSAISSNSGGVIAAAPSTSNSVSALEQTQKAKPTKVSDLPLTAISEAIANLTQAQKDEKLKPFRSLSTQVEGLVSDVSVYSDNWAQVYLDNDAENRLISLHFENSIKNIKLLKKKESLKATCNFNNITKSTISLDKCKLT